MGDVPGPDSQELTPAAPSLRLRAGRTYPVIAIFAYGHNCRAVADRCAYTSHSLVVICYHTARFRFCQLQGFIFQTFILFHEGGPPRGGIFAVLGNIVFKLGSFI